jgi:hypothetical protein
MRRAAARVGSGEAGSALERRGRRLGWMEVVAGGALGRRRGGG